MKHKKYLWLANKGICQLETLLKSLPRWQACIQSVHCLYISQIFWVTGNKHLTILLLKYKLTHSFYIQSLWDAWCNEKEQPHANIWSLSGFGPGLGQRSWLVMCFVLFAPVSNDCTTENYLTSTHLVSSDFGHGYFDFSQWNWLAKNVAVKLQSWSEKPSKKPLPPLNQWRICAKT